MERKKKKKKAIHDSKAWREFEKMVARIEKTLCDKGAIVKSPDHISDVVTGAMREVDASIRQKSGSTDILTTIECRRRKNKQDVTWIEQLKTKRDNIGASKTIAVSLIGFSKEAMDLAKRCGIDVRVIKNITDEEINKWNFEIIQFQYTYNDVNYFLSVENPEEYQKAFDEKLNQIKTSNQNTDVWDVKFLFNRSTNNLVSIGQIFERVLTQSNNSLAESYKNKQPDDIYTVILDIPKGSLYIPFEPNNINIIKIELSFKLSELVNSSLTPTNNFRYCKEDQDLVSGMEYKYVNDLGTERTLSVHQDHLSGKKTFTVWNPMKPA